jgi:hypothetical protein
MARGDGSKDRSCSICAVLVETSRVSDARVIDFVVITFLGCNEELRNIFGFRSTENTLTISPSS